MTASAAAAGSAAAARAPAAEAAGASAAESGGPTAAKAGGPVAERIAAGTMPRMRSGRRTAEETAGRRRIHGMDEGRRGRTAAIAPAPAQSAEYHGENNDQYQNIHVRFNLVDGQGFSSL